MAHSAAVGVRLAEARHLHRAHHAARNALTFHGVLHRDGVDRRAEHAHVIRVDGGHLRRRALTAAPDVARADHDSDFRARFVKLADHVGHTVDLLKIKQAAVVAQRFAAELDENALILCHKFLLSCPKRSNCFKKGAMLAHAPVWEEITSSSWPAQPRCPPRGCPDASQDPRRAQSARSERRRPCRRASWSH